MNRENYITRGKGNKNYMKTNLQKENAAKVNQITEGVIWKQLLLFFFPILFGTLFQQVYNTADTVVVGRFVGKEALAAVGGSSSMIVNLIVGFFVGLCSGAAVVISQYYGAKDSKNLKKALHTSMIFCGSQCGRRHGRFYPGRADPAPYENTGRSNPGFCAISPHLFCRNFF